MGVLSKLEHKATGMRAPNSLLREPVSVTVLDGKTSEIRPHTLDANEEHELLLTLRATYWANQAQAPAARKVAERSLASLLYSDLEPLLQLVEHAIYVGDARDAMHWLGKMRSVMRAESEE